MFYHLVQNGATSPTGQECGEVLSFLLPAWSPALGCSPAGVGVEWGMTPGPLSRAPGPVPSGRSRPPPPPQSCPALPDPGLSSALICIFLPLFPGRGQSACGERRGRRGRGVRSAEPLRPAGCRAGGSRCGRGTAALSLNSNPNPQPSPVHRPRRLGSSGYPPSPAENASTRRRPPTHAPRWCAGASRVPRTACARSTCCTP